MEHFLHLFAAGGLMMYPLVLASVASVAIAINRAALYRKSRADLASLETDLPALLKARDFAQAADLCRRAGGAAGELLAAASERADSVADLSEYLSGQASKAATELKAHLELLSTLVTLSPLMGLLGTVIGMIQSFDVLSVSEGEPFAITGGVAEALVATGTGLFVAILALLLHAVLSGQANRIIGEIEAASSLFLASTPEDRAP